MSPRTPHPEREERGLGQKNESREVEMQSDCERIAPTLHRYVEGELDRIRSQMVETHIAECSACLSEKERLDLERLWLVETAFAGPVLSTRLVEKIMEPVRREATAKRRGWGLRYAAAAACLLAVVVVHSSSSPDSWRSGSPDGGSALVSTTPSPAVSSGAPGPVRVSDLEGHLTGDEVRRLDGGRRDDDVRLGFDDTWPLERGGFRVGVTNPTFVDFGPRNISCLPQSTGEDHSDLHEELSCGVLTAELARGPLREGGLRIYRVKLIRGSGTTTFRFRFRDTVGIAMRLRHGDRSGHDSLHPEESIDVEPCFPDPNLDGKTDSRDIAYGLQVLYGAQPPDVLTDETAALDSECDSSCLRA